MPDGPGTYGSKVGRPPKKYKVGGELTEEMVGLSPPLDPRGGLERELRDISNPRTTEPPRHMKAFAPFEKEKKKKKKKKKKMNAGGKVGRGYGKARGAKACKYVSMKGA